jgi:hypothetical protein
VHSNLSPHGSVSAIHLTLRAISRDVAGQEDIEALVESGVTRASGDYTPQPGRR